MYKIHVYTRFMQGACMVYVYWYARDMQGVNVVYNTF